MNRLIRITSTHGGDCAPCTVVELVGVVAAFEDYPYKRGRATALIRGVDLAAMRGAVYRKRLADATTKALRVGLDLYSLRRTFSALCESAGVVESRRWSYMGHGPKNVGDLYHKTVVLPSVAEDAAKVAAYIETQRRSIKTPITLVKDA